MDSIWTSILGDILGALAALAVTALSTMGGFYVKRLTDNMKKKSLIEETSRYVRWAEQTKTFSLAAGEIKFNSVMAKMVAWAADNGINISNEELAIIIESSVKLMKEAEGTIVIEKQEDAPEVPCISETISENETIQPTTEAVG